MGSIDAMLDETPSRNFSDGQLAFHWSDLKCLARQNFLVYELQENLFLIPGLSQKLFGRLQKLVFGRHRDVVSMVNSLG